MSENDLREILECLQIPSEYAHAETAETIARLNSWKSTSTHLLRDLSRLAKEKELSVAEQANVIAAAVSFDGENSWTSPESHALATEILSDFSEPDSSLMFQLLETDVNPLFRPSLHPSLNPSTGRKLDRPAGGPMGTQDFYETQTWKKYPAAGNLVSWCLRHIQSQDYDRLWYLVIPPIMTFLDDYQVPYKLEGVRMVEELLQHVPREILKRTGVDGLILTSLNTCLAQLDDAESPQLIQTAISASLSLSLLTTNLGSSAQFDQLCALLGERIVGTIWLYSYDKPGVVQASVDSLPPLLSALGLGCCRYLKALIPQLLHPLLPVPFTTAPFDLQISSLHVLTVIMNECPCRMSQWQGTILDGISRCWVNSTETQLTANHSGVEKLKKHLRSSCEALAKVCPTIIEGEFRRLLVADYEMFQDLVAGIA
ncbi:hypothetical protein J3R30DRAFT_3659960 [Lentinula aciculospora]|uniref:ARM repeat-containing protein n=1 Tax=Lentinula aciculospora TaxID=153920 RepID=A0A9W9A178_9AGAR|nr:hypothetical protein J3R30DRAFT_3659960 [Lentinula aciculospora]